MDYQDFTLQLDRAPGEPGFLTRVIRSPAGEAEAPFVNPISPAELDGLWRRALATRQASRERGSRDVGPKPLEPERPAPELSLKELGGRLFQALFQGPVRGCWDRSLVESERSSNRGLRLKLQLNLSDPLLAPLAELPWEYLFSPEQGRFLGLQRKTPVLRHVRLPLPVGQPPVAQPLRILTVSSQPRSMSPLALEDEDEKIATALQSLPGVEALLLRNPTVEELREALLQKDFHVLHFMGHGGFDRESGQGLLFFTGTDGSPLPVSGDLLASHLADLCSLRLVFLNACDTARANAREPFAGVGNALLLAGLPAVIAMQRPIQDESALEFSRTVYRRLALGDPIDAAVTEGRLAIARGQGALLEWGTPVLFLRAEDGRLFAPEPPGEQLPAPQAARSKRPFAAFVLAGILSVGLAFGYLQYFGTKDLKTETDPGTPITSEQKTAKPPVVITEKAPAKPPPAPPSKKVHHDEPPEPEPEKPRSSTSHSNSAYTVSDGSSATVPDLNAEVGANFYEREGHAFVRFWITPPGEGMLQQPPVVGPGTIEFPAGSGTYRLDVLSLDLTQKRASVRLKLLPKSTA